MWCLIIVMILIFHVLLFSFSSFKQNLAKYCKVAHFVSLQTLVPKSILLLDMIPLETTWMRQWTAFGQKLKILIGAARCPPSKYIRKVQAFGIFEYKLLQIIYYKICHCIMSMIRTISIPGGKQAH